MDKNRRHWLMAITVASLMGTAACSDQLSGPQPEVTGEPGADEASGRLADPAFTCNEWQESLEEGASKEDSNRWVRVQGEQFAPVVAGSLKDSDVKAPVVRLERSRSLEGEYDGGVSRVRLGEEQYDSSHYQWVDDGTVWIKIDQELELKPGVYDVLVENNSGETARRKQAFGVLGKPTVEAVRPDLVCSAQDDRGVTIEGGPFVRDAESGEVPTVRVGENLEFSGAADADQVTASGCTEMDGPFSGYELCERLEVTVAQGQFQGNFGRKSVEIENVAPADCQSDPSEDEGEYWALQPPSIDSISPMPVCSKQQSYELEVSGQRMLRIRHQGDVHRPTLMIAGGEYDVTSLEDCEPIGERNDDRCQTAYVEVPAGELDDVSQGTMTPLQAGDTGTTDTSDGGTTDTSGDAADTGTSDSGPDATMGDTSDGGMDAGGGDAGVGDPTPKNRFTQLDVTLRNPEPAGCVTPESADLTTLPPPVVHDVTPDPVCSANQSGTETMTVEGYGFVKIGDQLPTVTVGGTEYEPNDFSADSDACSEVTVSMAGQQRPVLSCDTLTVDVPAGDHPGPQAPVSVTNPEPASCQAEGSAPYQVGPAPTVSDVAPLPICTADGERQVEILGDDFYRIDGETPSVQLAVTDGSGMVTDSVQVSPDRLEDCDQGAVDDATEDVQRCRIMHVTVPEDDFLAPTYDEIANDGPSLVDVQVGVTNPDGASCTSTEELSLYTAGPPVVDSVGDGFACLADGEKQFTIEGSNFLRIDTGTGDFRRPMVEIDGDFYEADSVGNCSGFTDPSLDEPLTEHCSQLTFSLPQDQLLPGAYEVAVHQPEPARCSGTDTATLEIFGPPVVERVEDSPVCTAQNNQYTETVVGETFLFNETSAGLETPTVELATRGGGTQEVAVTSPTDPAQSSNCSSTSVDGLYSCTQMQFGIDASQDFGVPSDLAYNEVLVTNPEPADCTSDRTGTLVDAPPPSEITNARIVQSCPAATRPDQLVVEGDFYFEVGGSKPVVEVTDPNGNTEEYSGSAVTLQGNCSQVVGATQPTRECSEMRIGISNNDAVDGGSYTVSVQNQPSVQCSRTDTEDSVSVEQPTDRPEITGVEESEFCVAGGAGNRLTINGSNFESGADVTIDGVPASDVQVQSENQIIAEWNQPFSSISSNPTLGVRNPNGCQDTLDLGGITFVEGALAIFVEPRVHYNQIEVEGTVYFANDTPSRQITNVQVRRAGSERTLTSSDSSTGDGQVAATLPGASDPLDPGEYDLRVTEEVNQGNGNTVQCGRWIDDLLEVTDSEDLVVSDIRPDEGWMGESTSVRLTAPSDSNLSQGETNFQQTPRVYISPNFQSGQSATELSAVSFSNDTEITGIVPGGLDTGLYDVVVVNPDGTVGVVEDGFEVVSDRTPEITNVTPATWESGRTIAVDVIGENLRVDSSQTSPTPIEVACDDGPSPSSVTVTGTGSTAEGDDLVEVDVDTNGMTTPDSCVVTLTNPDGTQSRFAPIITVNPSSKSLNWGSAAELNTARRWPAVSTGEPSSLQRFLYVIGGDDGSATGALSSGEFAQLDQFGNPGDWQQLPDQSEFDSPRTLAHATRVNDFIYVTGGYDGTTATDTILRSNVLDPEHVPAIENINFEIVTDRPGLDPGVYYYRVSGLHDANSAHNPSGETLPSNVQPVYVPDLTNRNFGIHVEIVWSSSRLSNLRGYRVYRTPNPDMNVGDGELLNEITDPTTTSDLDENESTDSSRTPLPLGALGEWHQPIDQSDSSDATLNEGVRTSHAVRRVIDPTDAEGSTAWIYVMGGQTDPTGGSLTAYDSIERINVVNADSKRSQSISGVTTLGATMSTARYEAQGMVATRANASQLSNGDDAYLYVAGGNGSLMGTGTTTIDAWPINSDGTLGTQFAGSLQRSRAGFVSYIASGFGFAQYGHNASVSDNGDQSELNSDGTFVSWSDVSARPPVSRYQMGREPAFGYIYVAGGQVQGGSASSSVDFAVAGSTRR